ncbi:MAG TPA: CdaR family protein [Candidatus Dormibacteraeota bacterium]
MSWITNDWKLKLLALGLSVLMLGAVAFSQNPPTSRTMQVGINYSVPSGLILITPPKTTSVTVTGPADLVSAANPFNTAATADLAKATTGTSVNVNLIGKSAISGIGIQTTPVILNIDSRNVLPLNVGVREPQGIAIGWSLLPDKTFTRCPGSPCTVTFDGPASWQKNLKAYADYPLLVSGSNDFGSAPVVLVQNATTLDLKTYTVPQMSLDIPTVSIHVEAFSNTTSRQVTLVNAQPVNPQPSCYQITNVTVAPITIVLSGPSDAVPNATTITLPGVDLSGHTSDFTFRVSIAPLLPTGVTSSVATAQVTYSISRTPNCT